MNYKPVIGLEVHVELKTASKMFCTCSTDYFGQTPNTHTCPVCLGLPGALPVPNKKAIEWCVMIGMALNCQIPLNSKFDRKNYFYPDLPKGYQISQYDQPFAQNGHMTLSDGKVIGIRRAHMEEDTGKLIHETINGERVTLIDFNRSSVPLVEIVTEPDFENATQVKEYLQRLQQIVRYLGVSNADMEKGEMRLEPNISLREISSNSPRPMGEGQSRFNRDQGEGFELPNYKVEVKNINSFSFVEKAINFEVERQAAILDEGKTPLQETRGWDEDKKGTVSQRIKEEAADYRYFPEPDIPPIVWTTAQIEEIRANLPELPDAKKTRFIKEYALSEYNAELLSRDRATGDYFEEAVKAGKEAGIDATKVANTIINKKVDIEKVLPAELIKDIKSSQVQDTMDPEELKTILKNVLEANPQSVADYQKGKTNAIMYLVGQAMREVKGRAKADTVRQALEELLIE